MQKRNFCAGNNLKTSIRLEKQFFDRLDQLAKQAGASWRDYTLALLENKPQNVSRSSHIRVSLLEI